MLKYIKKYIHKLSHKPSFWQVLYILSVLFRVESFKERLLKIRAERNFFKKINYNTTILSGPFEGMKYPEMRSSYSEMAPKIIGSYESELFDALHEILNKKYAQVIDIGCAEGYYAIGLALKLPEANVYAFDIDPKALKMCDEMAVLNKVSDRVHLGPKCSNNTLKTFDFKEKSLIISDCEGYELELFTDENIQNLRNCDLLIELHDILGIEVKNKLLPVFALTHNVQIISSLSRNPNLYPVLGEIDDREKQIVLSECRDGLFGTKSMEWAYITSKSDSFNPEAAYPRQKIFSASNGK